MQKLPTLPPCILNMDWPFFELTLSMPKPSERFLKMMKRWRPMVLQASPQAVKFNSFEDGSGSAVQSV